LVPIARTVHDLEEMNSVGSGLRAEPTLADYSRASGETQKMW
jgi:hypothetical protein